MRISRVLRDALLSLLLAEEPGPDPHSYCLTLIWFQQQRLPMYLSSFLSAETQATLNCCKPLRCLSGHLGQPPEKTSASPDPCDTSSPFSHGAKAMSHPAALWVLWGPSSGRAKTLVKIPWWWVAIFSNRRTLLLSGYHGLSGSSQPKVKQITQFIHSLKIHNKFTMFAKDVGEEDDKVNFLPDLVTLILKQEGLFL